MAKSEWTAIDPRPLFRTSPYGFVVDHPTYWGIPIHGDNIVPPPEDANYADITNPPSGVEIQPPHVAVDCAWTGGDFSILATCTPPLFHSFHHKTDEFQAGSGGHGGHGAGQGESAAFDRRSEMNVLERPFSDASPLPGRGRFACVHFFDVSFDQNGQPQGHGHNAQTLPFSSFDSRMLIQQARRAGYFATRWMTWDDSLVRPLNAIWFVVLQAGTRNTPLSRLGESYRLWHRLGHTGEPNSCPVPNGYKWTIEKHGHDDNRYRVAIELSGSHNITPKMKPKPCPDESVTVTFEYKWIHNGNGSSGGHSGH